MKVSVLGMASVGQNIMETSRERRRFAAKPADGAALHRRSSTAGGHAGIAQPVPQLLAAAQPPPLIAVE
jgi:hypothetical protein